MIEHLSLQQLEEEKLSGDNRIVSERRILITPAENDRRAA